RLASVCDMEAGNLFLAEFMVRFNEKFAVRAARTENLHRPVTVRQIACGTSSATGNSVMLASN
ncbi:MAG: hypothetical protein ACRYGF_05600, partial [Janthinobacterium lividum]